jgi:hypothetical protein
MVTSDPFLVSKEGCEGKKGVSHRQFQGSGRTGLVPKQNTQQYFQHSSINFLLRNDRLPKTGSGQKTQETIEFRL